MTDSLDHLIDQLASEGAKKPLPHPVKQVAGWMFGIVLYLAVVTAVSGLRGDWAQKFTEPLYLVELMLLLTIGVSAAMAALCLARPDAHQIPWIRFVPLGLLVPWGIIAFGNVDMMNASILASGMKVSGFDCAVHLTVLSLLPALALFALLRKGAATRFFWAAGMACLSATSVVYLSMRILEQTDNPWHLLLWHALPAALLSLVGAALGRLILRWK